EKELYLEVLNEIDTLPKYIQSWIDKSVDSPERFEFFVGSKAEEISTGDEKKDYFWAMQIRHDQLIAVTRVIGRLLEIIEKWVVLDPAAIYQEEVFQGLSEYSIEKQVYLEAENIHKSRQESLAR